MNTDSTNVKKPLLFISFFTAIRGNCPAEWADDKLMVLKGSDRSVFVLTGLGSHVKNEGNINFYSVPSISWNDLKEEIKELKAEGGSLSLWHYLFIPFAFVFGNIIDFILRKVTKGVSAGRWSWPLTALPVALYLKLRFQIKEVFSTGGPTSALVVAALLAKSTNAKFICEIQDPLLGATMVRSSLTRKIAKKLEKFLIKNSTKTVFVTKTAANAALIRNPNLRSHILSQYPGAWDYLNSETLSSPHQNDTIEFIHLGTLYGSRNLDLFFKALDELKIEGFKKAESVRVVNLGAVYCESLNYYKSRDNFEILPALERNEALKRAVKSDFLLLVQHKDPRSRETIPYKTYDYFNLNKTVFGILENDELKELIQRRNGFAANAADVNSIKDNLKEAILCHQNSILPPVHSSQVIDISNQFETILNLYER